MDHINMNSAAAATRQIDVLSAMQFDADTRWTDAS